MVTQKKKSLDPNDEEKKPNIFNRFVSNRKLNSATRSFESSCILAELEFNKLDRLAAYSSKVEPVKFVFQLLLGILFGIYSLIAII